MIIRKGPGLLLSIAVLLSLILLSPSDIYAQLGIQPPKPKKTVDLFEDPVFGLEGLPRDSTFFAKEPKALKRNVELDSTASYVSFSEVLDGTEFELPSVIDLETYVQLRIRSDVRELWKKTVVQGLRGGVSQDFGAIKLDIPFKIRSKTFTRIFGSDRISLNVTGNISFDLSGRTEKRSGSAINARENQNTFSPRFNQTQQFTVEGKIGEKVTVSVQQNSEAVMDIENTLKLRYDGDEDEIVKRIEAGNISLSLPSTKYVIFGGSNKGLFGLKSEMQVGNLYMTTIASLEKGQQQELSISGGSSESKTTVYDRDFIKNKYFFIDDLYRDQYELGYNINQAFSYIDGTDIVEMDVYISTSLSDPNRRSAVAVLDPSVYNNVAPADPDPNDPQIDAGVYRILEENEYEYDRYRGYLKLNQPVNDTEVLAVAYTNSRGERFGSQRSDTAGTMILKMIKPLNMQPTEAFKETWPLMMRNVYSLGGTNIEADGFDIRLQYNKTGQEQTHQDVDPRESFLNLLGLDVLDTDGNPIEGGDNKVDNNSNLINRADGILMFPSLRPFDPGENAPYQELAPRYKVRMYDISMTNRTALQDSSKFEMIVTSKSTKSTFDLGFYVLEGSEVVTLNGRNLQRDRDYVIDYFSGQLTLLSDEAKRSSSNIQVKYERANLFQLDKKTILGGRAEYRFLDDSFIGLTALYLNKSTIEQRVRVGQEPFQNFVWDINAAFRFKPHFLTKMVDALPFVETSDESRFNIEGEFAQVLPDPNTLNSESTGDNNGVAYIDDFESSKRTTTLGIRYKTWTKASPPAIISDLLPVQNIDQDDDLTPFKMVDTTANKARANVVWFNPYNQVHINDIWPNREVNAQTGQTTDVLGLEFWRDEGSDPDSAWAGMMRSTTSFADQQKTKYLELWVKGWKGTINIDIGRISEDWQLEGKTYLGNDSRRGLDTEDINENGLLDDGEDLGLDGVPGSDDPLDIWSEPRRGATNIFDGVLYDGINGTEGNGNARGARYPDTEDLNGNSKVDLFNEYFEYSFSLDSLDQEAKKWIVGSTDKGWRQFRIPLKDYTRKVGLPDTLFQQIFFTRMWLSDIPEQRTRIFIATFDFVGNEWEEEGISLSDTTGFFKNDSIFTLATYNTEENSEPIPGGPEPYTSPPGVRGVRDRITKARSKEQSLVMIFNNLKSGSRAEAKKTLYQNMELVNYKRLRMFVHGDRSLLMEPFEGDTSKIRFYLRFGSDERNYYEYGQDVYKGWNTLNEIDIDLDQLSAVKFLADSANQNDIIQKLHNDQRGYYAMRGGPSLKTIRYFTIGVINKDPVSAFTGELWLDEMRLSEVRKERATALRLKTELKLADLLRFNAEWESKDADFHNISTQFGGGSTEERQNYSGAIYLDKFLPEQWDLSIPIDARASFSRSIPKYLPKTDILSGYRNNSIEKKLRSLFGLREVPEELKDQISVNEIFGVGTTIKKRSKSKHWYLKYTIDQLSVDVDYSRKHSSTWDLKFNDSEQYKESVKYQIPFGNNNYVSPFAWAKKIPVVKKLSDQRLYYTPSNVSMSLNISDSETNQLRRAEGSELKRQANTNSTRSINSSYKLLNSLSFSYTRSYKSDADADSLKHEDMFKEIITKGNFGLDTDINQSFKGDYKPDLVKWLKTNFSFSSNFRYSLTNNYKYKQSANQIQKRVGATLNPNTLVNAIWSPKGGKDKTTSRRRTSRRRRVPQSQQEEQKKDDEQEEKEDEDDKKGAPKIKIPNPLMLIYNTLNSWKSIQTTYTISDNVTNQYLSDIPQWDYQFGFTKDPGVPQDLTLQNVQLQGPTMTQSKNLRSSTSINLAKNVKASFNHDIGTTITSSVGKPDDPNDDTRSGSNSITFLALGADPLKDFKGFEADIKRFIPDWSVQVSGVEQWLFFPSFAKSVTLDHGHSGKYTEKKAYQTERIDNETVRNFVPVSQSFTNSWQPLLGINIRTIWGLSSTIRTTRSTNYSYSKGGGDTRTENKSLTISMNYSKTAGFKIPIPVWPFKGRSFKNEINFSLTYDSSENGTYQRKFNEDKFNEKQKNTSWKLRPSATYRFNTRVQGSMFYEMGATKNKISGEYSWTEFGITVNIAIRD